jgi:hypothetical protein
MIRMPDGTRWASVAEAAREQRVRPGTIRVWEHRGLVRSHRDDAGLLWVCLDDVADAELAWRTRLARKARRAHEGR